MSEQKPGSTARVAILAAGLVLGASAALPARAAWRQQEFIIGGWTPGSADDRSRYLVLDHAGFNLVVNGDSYSRVEAVTTAAVLDSLRRARPDFHLKGLLFYDAIVYHRNADQYRNSIRAELRPERGLNSPSVEGWAIWDEPGTPQDFADIGWKAKMMAEGSDSADRLALVNLLPYYGLHALKGLPCGSEGREAYGCYLDQYLKLYDSLGVAPPVLCVDYYTFQIGRPQIEFYLTLEMMRERAAKYSRPGSPIPMWLLMQFSAFHFEKRPYFPAPTLAQLRWQAFGAVAYGVKGLIYWTLSPMRGGEFNGGFFDAAGRTLPMADSVRTLNLALRALGPTLLALEPLGALHQSAHEQTGLDSTLLSSPSRDRSVVRDLTGGAGDGLVGLFRHRTSRETYLMVVNKNLKASRTFTLTLARSASRVDRISQTDGKGKSVVSGTDHFDITSLAAGAGELFRVVP